MSVIFSMFTLVAESNSDRIVYHLPRYMAWMSVNIHVSRK